MPEFYTAYKKPETKESPAGNKEEPVYEIEIDETGHKKIIETGKTNIYDMIQESLEQSKIENIVRRATEGDANALSVVNGSYIDVTDMPSTLAEAQQFVIKAKNEFDTLPLQVRREYNFSAEQYIADYGTENWAKIIGIQKPEPKPTSETKPTAESEPAQEPKTQETK
ncbi:internal scaffolding protein [Peromfec virus RodF7_13]|uniref:Internal scaffolding protein n=1 Tax=Peromfec virus RodF7_13 TaxID=2929348 RepID=A0A976R7T3_9VIRU|nr:internal scaffolding protein [Peromfec virus RodF7_13]